jgi:hypothetical protein
LINAIILDLSHAYRSRRALKLSLSGPGAFLVNCSNKAFSISFSVIESSSSIAISGIEIAIEESDRSGNACFIKIASFSLTVIAISPFKDFIAGVIEKVLKEVYFIAV